MALPFWDESYATGDAVIDAQHRDLLALVAELDGDVGSPGSERTFLDMLDRVMDFTWVHFDMEETLMTRVGYPASDHVEMTQQHAEFKSYARIRVLEFRFGETDSTKPFAPFLRDWLVQHEFGLDRKLADFIQVTRQSRTAHGGSDPEG